MTTEVGAMGYPPELAHGTANPEAAKYGQLWERAEYRQVSPGEGLAPEFLEIARPKPGATVIDFGCGTGRGAVMLAILGRVKVIMVDFVRNSLDPDIREALTTQAETLSFVKADLEQPLPVHAPYGVCFDVMEHIPPDKVDRVLDHILASAQHVFFSIATVPDLCGGLIGAQLHLTVQPAEWWLQKFRDRSAIIHWSRVGPQSLGVYVTAWVTGQDVTDTGQINTDEETIKTNVRQNLADGWQQVRPHPQNETEVMLVGGGPSLEGFTEEIRKKRAEGVKLITFNGAYNWAIAQGLTPSATMTVDARPFNARFTKPVVDACTYFIASQCHPSVLEGLPKDRTWLYHVAPNLIGDILAEHYGGPEWMAIPGGSTVLLRAIPLLLMLGFHKFHLYGCDSCVVGGQHHAYAQPENDSVQIFPVSTNPGGRIFYCHTWQIAQATEFLTLVAKLGDLMDVAVYGDGLLAYLLQTGADIATSEEMVLG